MGNTQVLKKNLGVAYLRSAENRVQEIDSILKQLSAISKQFNCAVLGLAQLKREVDTRSEKRPTK
ncbi:DnaB-like helicase C-terminal domain-containing protein [Nostoc sp.]|uniref:DnaB-like helicase C-terminal domain-containing protein n=1 Tax=Nostoc sp. TaxID=1180 RepID=UPI002FEF0581